MPFFDPAEQQRLMQQMFTNPQGGPMPPSPQGQGGVGSQDGGTIIAPSFQGPDMGGMGAMGTGGGAPMGVDGPDQFAPPVPDIGDQGMVRQPPFTFDDNLPNDLMGDRGQNVLQGAVAGMTGGMPQLGEDQKRRLIEALMARGMQ